MNTYERHMVKMRELIHRMFTTGEDDRCDEIRDELDVTWVDLTPDEVERSGAESEKLMRRLEGRCG